MNAIAEIYKRPAPILELRDAPMEVAAVIGGTLTAGHQVPNDCPGKVDGNDDSLLRFTPVK